MNERLLEFLLSVRYHAKYDYDRLENVILGRMEWAPSHLSKLMVTHFIPSCDYSPQAQSSVYSEGCLYLIFFL